MTERTIDLAAPIDWDVVVVGGGNAALCAAISAAEKGAQVLVIESAPKTYRGGNSRHTRNFRAMHDGPSGVLEETYLEEEYYQDLLKVTKGKTDETLARQCIRESEPAYRWMMDHGVLFQPSLSGTLSLSRTNAFFLGGGKALVNAYYNQAERLDISVTYDTEVTHVQLAGNRFTHLEVTRAGKRYVVQGKALVLASGGFQSNLEWLTEAWGPAAANFLIRGTPYNRGVVLKDMLDQGALSVGDPTQCHAVAIDGRSPKFDGGIVTRLDCVPFSVVVNKHGERFYDEGEDVWPKRYAIWGRLVAAQPDQVAYVVIDAKSLNLFMPSVFPPEKADTLEALAAQLGLPVDAFMKTTNAFNAACGDISGFHSNQLDSVCTTGLTINKTNWARPINEGPFYAYQLRPGVTFTYLGLKVDPQAKVQMQDASAENIWAAGEIMAGSILGEGYLAGFGMTIGTVYGRIAGQEAGNYVSE